MNSSIHDLVSICQCGCIKIAEARSSEPRTTFNQRGLELLLFCAGAQFTYHLVFGKMKQVCTKNFYIPHHFNAHLCTNKCDTIMLIMMDGVITKKA
ncbi:MAG: hypothetical protein ACRCUY_02930 [Thermoguttaceae bacterium]